MVSAINRLNRMPVADEDTLGTIAVLPGLESGSRCLLRLYRPYRQRGQRDLV